MDLQFLLNGTELTGNHMAEVKQFKVVSALPGTLEANSIYYVRSGAGVDIYVTNSSGTIVAYRHNQGEAKPWTGAADYDAITEGTWIVTSALAHAPAQFTTGHDSIVTVKRLDGDRLVQQVYNFVHNISVFRMRIMWQGSPVWAGWQEPAMLDDWIPITSLLNGYTPLAGFPNRFRQLGKCLQLQLYANAASATRTAGTTIWSVPFLYRPAHLCPIQARVDLSSTAGQWANSANLIIDGDVKLGPALAAAVQKIAIDVLIPLGAP